MNGPRADVILIAGPTASGKTSAAIARAHEVGGEIVNADSMQVYPHVPVLTAQPDADELAAAPHHLFGHADIAKPYSVARWLADAVPVIEAIRDRGKVPIVVGGTGLYFKALLEGLSTVPPIDPSIRDDVRARAEKEGAETLHRELKTLDPAIAAQLRPGDTHRIARALEVKLSTGHSLLDYRAKPSSAPLAGTTIDATIIMPPRPVLHERIERRAVAMLVGGAVEEVQHVLSLGLPEQATVLRAIGLPQIDAYLSGELDEAQCLARLQAATRQYAKRQCTFFRGQFDERWTTIDAYSPT